MKARLFSSFAGNQYGKKVWFVVADDGLEIKTNTKEHALAIAAMLKIELDGQPTVTSEPQESDQ